MSLYVEKTKKYKKTLQFCSIMAFIGKIIFLAVLSTGNFWLISIGISFTGFFLLPILPIGFELACEITFPVGEAVSNGALISGSQLLAIFMVTMPILLNCIIVIDNVYEPSNR